MIAPRKIATTKGAIILKKSTVIPKPINNWIQPRQGVFSFELVLSVMGILYLFLVPKV
jgi:hypothetical protein